MVSSPTSYPKRTCAVSLLQHTKNPILLAKTMLERSQNDLHGSRSGAQGHSHLSGPVAESMAQGWGLEMVPEEYFWTRKRWDEHIRGLKKNKEAESSDGTKTAKNADSQSWEEKIKGGRAMEGVEAQEGWDGESYLPQGTVGCVCLDREGKLCVATSTGGLTNKLDGRIGDTPTAGAGYWANEWTDAPRSITPKRTWWGRYPIVDQVNQLIINCLPSLSQIHEELYTDHEKLPSSHIRAVAMSGTGNGDSFLRLSACHTAASIAQYSPRRSLASAVRQVAGPGGELQRSAMNRWGRTGEGEGGIAGIELIEGKGKVVWDFNCGGMFRCWVDDAGRDRIMVFRDEYHGLG